MATPRTVLVYGTLVDGSSNPVLGGTIQGLPQSSGSYPVYTHADAAQFDTIDPTIPIKTLTASTGPGAAPTGGVTAGGALSTGNYSWSVSFVNASGETAAGPLSAPVLASPGQAGSLTAIPLGPAGTTARVIYRTQAGGSQATQVATIGDNTTTTYTDTASDASIVNNPVAMNPGGWRLGLVAPTDTSGLGWELSLNGGLVNLTSFAFSASPVRADTLYASAPPPASRTENMTGYLTDGHGNPLQNYLVQAYINVDAVNTYPTPSISVKASALFSVYSDINGFYQLPLYRNSDLAPVSGLYTWYSVLEGPGSVKLVNVPVGGGPVNDNLVTLVNGVPTPLVLNTTQAAQLAAIRASANLYLNDRFN